MSEQFKKPIDTSQVILSYDSPLDHKLLMEYIDIFCHRYKSLRVGSLATSILGRSIPIITLGNGPDSNAVVYVGSHHGMEWISSIILLKFINEYLDALESGANLYNYDMEYINKTRKYYIIPMLNPDGVDYAINGIDEFNPLYLRLIDMNGGSEDFSRWQANARGVDLNHNYNAGFHEYKVIEAEKGIFNGAPSRFSGVAPESEPETAALTNFLRFRNKIKMILTLHSQGEEIYYSSGEVLATQSQNYGERIANLTGYVLSKPEGMAAYGGLTDWYIRAFNKPSFTIELGHGRNPLPLSDYKEIYLRMRELLFIAPTF